MMNFSGKQLFQVLRIIHLALMAGLILFSVVVIFFTTSTDRPNSEMDSTILFAVAGALTFMGIFISPMLFKQQLSKLQGTETFQQKMAAFQTAHIIRSALFEAGGLFGAVICIVSGNLYGLVFTAISVGMFMLKMPTPDMLEQDLNLNSEEKRSLTID